MENANISKRHFHVVGMSFFLQTLPREASLFFSRDIIVTREGTKSGGRETRYGEGRKVIRISLLFSPTLL